MVVVKCKSCDWQITTISGHVHRAAKAHAVTHLLMDTAVEFESEVIV